MTESELEKGVQKAVETLRRAMIDGKREDLLMISSQNLSYGHSNGNVESKQEFVENIASGKSNFVTIDLSEQNITVTGNVAVVRHRFSAVTNDPGNPGMVNLKVLLVFINENGGWKLLARQAVRLAAL